MISTILESIFIEPWPFWAGGIIIGLLVPMLYYFYNTALGVSTGYGNLAKIFLPARHLQWIKSKYPETYNWRVYFIGGMILGGFISSALSGNAGFTAEMGSFTAIVSWPALAGAVYLFSGGILLGLGARMAGGCTSGHSIHGIANLHISSILATIMFLIGGFISANLIRISLMGGAW